jgi:hypothetical protein
MNCEHLATNLDHRSWACTFGPQTRAENTVQLRLAQTSNAGLAKPHTKTEP